MECLHCNLEIENESYWDTVLVSKDYEDVLRGFYLHESCATEIARPFAKAATKALGWDNPDNYEKHGRFWYGEGGCISYKVLYEYEGKTWTLCNSYPRKVEE